MTLIWLSRYITRMVSLVHVRMFCRALRIARL